MEADTPGARIFVVEDESIVAMDIQSRLSTLGYRIAGRAADGEGAVEKVLDTKPDCVLMDIKLKGEMDGIEAAGRIQERLNVPVIYLTAFTDKETLERARFSNPFGYILKPFQERELAVTIEMAIYKHRMEKELYRSREFLQKTLENINDAVLVTGEDRKILYSNPAAQELLMEPRKGRGLEDVLRGYDGDNLPRGDAPARGYELPLEGSRGEEQELEVDYSPILTEGRCNGGVYVFRDMSQRRQYEATLREARAQAEEVNRTRERLLANISHELRTPLNSIIGMAELALSETGDPRITEYLQVALQSAGSLLQVINSLLDYSRMERGGIALENEEVRLPRLLEETAEPFRQKASGKGVGLELTAAADLNRKVTADPKKLQMILNQLLDNAVKFSERGTVGISLDWAHQEDWEGLNFPTVRGGACPRAVRIDVADQGRGIPKERAEKIFAAFTQEDSSATRRYGGLGIGLTLVKELAEMMGGRVSLVPSPEEGSHFRVILPVQEGETRSAGGELNPGDTADDGEGAAAGVQAAGVQAAGVQADGVQADGGNAGGGQTSEGQPSVLALVEDDPTNRFVTSRLLKQKGYQVEELDSASSFYDYLGGGGNPRAVLLDIQMPEIDGYTVLQEMRRGELGDGCRQLPVVVLTAHAFEEDRQRCYSYGADGYITKPFDAAALYKVLEENLGESRGRQEEPGNKPETEDPGTIWEEVGGLIKGGEWNRADERIRVWRDESKDRIDQGLSRCLLKLSLALRQEDLEKTEEWLSRCREKMEDMSP